MVSFTPQLVYPRGKSYRYPLDRRPNLDSGPIWTTWRREKSCHGGNRTRAIRSVAIPTELFRLPRSIFQYKTAFAWFQRPPPIACLKEVRQNDVCKTRYFALKQECFVRRRLNAVVQVKVSAVCTSVMSQSQVSFEWRTNKKMCAYAPILSTTYRNVSFDSEICVNND
jgi:hypothetical protein